MVRIWADLLGSTEPIGVHDNLFGLGGGSLAAVRFAAWTADTYGVYLAIHHIVATPTIAALAEIVSADLDSARTSPRTRAGPNWRHCPTKSWRTGCARSSPPVTAGGRPAQTGGKTGRPSRVIPGTGREAADVAASIIGFGYRRVRRRAVG